MLPLRLVVLISVSCFLAAPSHATWVEAGNVTIRIVDELGGLDFVEANQIGLDADVYDVFVGSVSETGTLTVVGLTDNVRADLGGWTVTNGQGNVQSVFGDGGFVVGSGTQADDLDGVLEFVDSDVTGSITVRKGNLNVRAGSRVENMTLHPLARADIVEGSHIGRLTSNAGSLAILQDSFAISTGTSTWAGSVRADDSRIEVGGLQIGNGADVEIGLASFVGAELAMTGSLDLTDASLAISQAEVATGSLHMRGADTSLDVASSTWTNAGILDFHPSSTVGPVTLDIHGGADFHSMGLVRVSGHAAYEQLQVRGAGTRLEVDGDLRIGEYVVSGPVQHFTGTVTVADGATIVVHGTLRVDSQAVLNLNEGGTIYAETIDSDGTINENGGSLILPEPAAAAGALVAVGVVAALGRTHRLASRDGVNARARD